MTKCEIRLYLNSLKPFIKMSAVAKKCGCLQQNLSIFLNGYDGSLSHEKLLEIVNFLKNMV